MTYYVIQFAYLLATALFILWLTRRARAKSAAFADEL